MEDQISRKTGNVADFPLKMNLQMFAGEEDGTPNLEDSADFKDDAREFDSKMAKYTEERTPKADTETEKEPDKGTQEAVKPDVAAPDEKPKQDPETNKAFQEMRQKLKEAEQAKADVEAKARKADELIASQYGNSHGIFTVEQYERRLLEEQQQEDNERYEAAGLTDEEIRKIREYDQIKQGDIAKTEEAKAQEHVAQWNSLYTAYPEIVESSKVLADGKEPDWLNDEMKAEIARGASPLAAYRSAHFETILQSRLGNAKEIAKQEALDKINSKEHLAPNASTGGEVDHVDIDDETMRAYRALNKGKTDAQIRAWHKKHAN